MNFKTMTFLGAVALGTSAMAQVGVDGVKGVEWTGVVPTHVTYDANAPTSNFANPSHLTAGASYDVYIRQDGNYVYGLIQATDNWDKSASSDFANIYFGGPSIVHGFILNVTAQGATETGTGNMNTSTAGYETFAQHFDPMGDDIAIEFALDTDYLRNDPTGVGFTKYNNGDLVRFSASQSLSYSYDGYNPNDTLAPGVPYYNSVTRLGGVILTPKAVPEPASMAALGLGALGFLRRRAKR